jgi:hypothetical protein
MADRRASDLPQIKALLQDRAEMLVKDLLPAGCRKGKYWMAANPTRNDRHAGSFWVALSGVPGSWRDEATGEKGDIIQLIRYLRGGDFKDAMQFARGWLGIGDMPPEQVAQVTQAARERRKEAEAREEEEEAKRRRAAHAHWLNCWESLLGTKADAYLLGRAIDLRKLPRQPGALRFAPNEEHRESGERWPCIVAAMSGPGGAVHAIHRTFIARDGSGKAPIDPQRKMWPRMAGAAIHLWRGKSDRPASGAPKASDVLALVEGVEDGLTAALACPEMRVWCAGSLGNLQNIRIPACASRVVVCADNDWGKPQAQALLEKGLAALHAQGVPVGVCFSPIGKDLNDALRGGANRRCA